MLGVISFVFGLGIIVLIHELGHFLVAKHYGVLCHEFSIGMGPAIYSKRIGETVYSIRAIPIGGYVAMAGEEVEKDMLKVGQPIGIRLNDAKQVDRLYFNPTQSGASVQGEIKSFDVYQNLKLELEHDGVVTSYAVSEDAFYVIDEKQKQQIAPYSRCLESKSKFARFATMAAGATMNFILAFVLMVTVGAIQGVPTYSSEIAMVQADSAAEEAGVLAGDVIVDFNDQRIETWDDLTAAINDAKDETVTITVNRDDEFKTFNVTPTLVNGKAMIGITPNPVPISTERSLGYALEYGVEGTKNAFNMILQTFEMLFVTKEAGVSDLSGPVGIFQMTSQAATLGLTTYIAFIAFLSVNIGVLNLLPFPALDGGRIIFVLIEAIIRRPVSRKVEGMIHTVGLFLFFGLFVYVTFNDVIRLIFS